MGVGLSGDTLVMGTLRVGFVRTLRVPEAGGDHPLPPGLGTFPVRRVADLPGAPLAWRMLGGVVIPMYRREALWISLHAPADDPRALRIAAGGVNVVSGDPWSETLTPGACQDYVVVPPQPWIDGINAGEGRVRQFVAMPLGEGTTVEAQVTGAEATGGLQLLTFPLTPQARERLPRRPEPSDALGPVAYGPPAPPLVPIAMSMGIAAGGWIHQQIEEDPHASDDWAPEPDARLFVHLVDAAWWPVLTGEPAPPTPVSARTYTEHGFPWFERYAETDVPAATVLAGIRSVGRIAAERLGAPEDHDAPIVIGSDQVVDLTEATAGAQPPR